MELIDRIEKLLEQNPEKSHPIFELICQYLERFDMWHMYTANDYVYGGHPDDPLSSEKERKAEIYGVNVSLYFSKKEE